MLYFLLGLCHLRTWIWSRFFSYLLCISGNKSWSRFCKVTQIVPDGITTPIRQLLISYSVQYVCQKLCNNACRPMCWWDVLLADMLCLYQVQRETFDRFGTLLSISRGCVSKCPYGCYYHNYGATTVVCISCCRTRGCNVGNSAIESRLLPSNVIIVLLLLLCTRGQLQHKH